MTEIECKLCKVTNTSEASRSAHQSGQKHLKAILVNHKLIPNKVIIYITLFQLFQSRDNIYVCIQLNYLSYPPGVRGGFVESNETDDRLYSDIIHII